MALEKKWREDSSKEVGSASEILGSQGKESKGLSSKIHNETLSHHRGTVDPGKDRDWRSDVQGPSHLPLGFCRQVVEVAANSKRLRQRPWRLGGFRVLGWRGRIGEKLLAALDTRAAENMSEGAITTPRFRRVLRCW